MLKEITLLGQTIDLYFLFNTIGSLSLYIWIILNFKYYREISTFSHIPKAFIFGKKKNFFTEWIFAFIEAFIVFFVVWTPLAEFISKTLSNTFLHDQSANYLSNIIGVPICFIIFGIILLISPLKLLDLAAPSLLFALIFFKIACFCCGCCYGIPDEQHGMFNSYTNRMEFPVQLVEAACAVIMLVIILKLWRKKDRKPGILYPLFMLMYSASRFVSEFWRGDYPKVLGPLTGYHIQLIIGFVEGLILLFVVLKWGDKITEFFDKKRQSVIERCKVVEEMSVKQDSNSSSTETIEEASSDKNEE